LKKTIETLRNFGQVGRVGRLTPPPRRLSKPYSITYVIFFQRGEGRRERWSVGDHRTRGEARTRLLQRQDWLHRCLPFDRCLFTCRAVLSKHSRLLPK